MFTNQKLAHGGSGFIYIDDTSPTTGEKIFHIHFLEDTVISAITYDDDYNATDLSGVTIPAGHYIAGAITGITLTSGSCICYLV